MSDENHVQSDHSVERRGAVDPIMQRQLDSEHHCFRVIGELRLLLGAFSQEGTPKERWQEFRERGGIVISDPSLIDKVAAQRLLKDIYHETMGNPEIARWLEAQFSVIDPGDPTWLELKRAHDNKEKISENPFEMSMEKFSSILVFKELCHECDDRKKTMEFLMENAPSAILSLALATSPIPPPSKEAREDHMKELDEDPEYRDLVESTLGMIKQSAAKDPRIIEALRESMKMTRFIGFPPDSKAKEHFAVAREDVDALLHAMETGEIDIEKKQ